MESLSNLEQAKHNESVCNYLGKKESYSDWVITTAFYSAIHFVRHLMLPHVEGGITYTTYEALFSRKKAPTDGRHGFQSTFVILNYSDIEFEYQRLYDFSVNARYLNYKYTRAEASQAKAYLQIIKAYVSSQKPDFEY